MTSKSPLSSTSRAELRYSLEEGRPVPLGATYHQDRVNFALYAKHATACTLCLYDLKGHHPLAHIPLDPKKNRTGGVWHISIGGLPDQVAYTYSLDGPKEPAEGLFFYPDEEVVDPYAKAVHSHPTWGEERESPILRGVAFNDHPFDWEGTTPPRHAFNDLVIYEMHVRGFTQDGSSHSNAPGTFQGIIDKIPYLQNLGVNAIELMPVFEFDECAYRGIGPISGHSLYNFWGYATLNFFTPMTRFAAQNPDNPNPLAALTEFKRLVRECHRAGIEVILDVVYNHSGENCFEGPSLSFRGLAAPDYYLLGPKGEFYNYSGCGNTLNCNHPIVRDLIVESLRYWVSEMHVDGFRFDLASVLTRGRDGLPLENPPVIEAISEDPVLAHTKLIAEAWDAAGLYQVGHFPHLGPWADWNGKYRDRVRAFIKGCDGAAGEFATSIGGSEDVYGHAGRSNASINFITSHDGFSLRDLVSYNDKHNLDNGEENRDGANHNQSWNCGVEGHTDDPAIITLRERQIRNFHLALMVSQGVPMILMGDEYGHTKNGNNNTWCQDNPLNWFQWDSLEEHRDFYRFYRGLIHFRCSHPLLKQPHFLDTKRITWHGHAPGKADWSHDSRFVAFTLHDWEKGEDIYAAFNAHFEQAMIALPRQTGRAKWHRIVDTALPAPHDFVETKKASPVDQGKPYLMQPHSAILLLARVPGEAL